MGTKGPTGDCALAVSGSTLTLTVTVLHVQCSSAKLNSLLEHRLQLRRRSAAGRQRHTAHGGTAAILTGTGHRISGTDGTRTLGVTDAGPAPPRRTGGVTRTGSRTLGGCDGLPGPKESAAVRHGDSVTGAGPAKPWLAMLLARPGMRHFFDSSGW